MSQLTRTRTLPQVNLLPQETREQQQSRKKVGVVALVGALVVGLLVLYSVTMGSKVHSVEEQLATVNSENGALGTEAQSLQHFAQLRDDLSARRTLVEGALAGGVRWSSVLQDLSRVMPKGMWLTGVTATMGNSAAAAGVPTDGSAPAPVPSPAAPVTTTTGVPAPAAPAPGQIIASLSFTGYAFDIPTISTWLRHLQTVGGWVNPWATQTERTQQGGKTLYSFSSTVDITSDYLAENGSDS